MKGSKEPNYNQGPLGRYKNVKNANNLHLKRNKKQKLKEEPLLEPKSNHELLKLKVLAPGLRGHDDPQSYETRYLPKKTEGPCFWLMEF